MLHGYGPAILGGLMLTLQLAAASLCVACMLGLLGAVGKLSQSRSAQFAVNAYTTLIRGVPELLLMLMVFYGGQMALNAAGERLGWGYVEVPAFAAGALTIGFVFGAYMTETFRGAILAVPKGQIEAAQSVGMTALQILTRITLPQMVRHAIPGFANNWLVMIKATALVSIIGLDDMVSRAGLASSATREPLTFYVLIACIYLGLTSLSILALRHLERRYSVGVRKVELA